jgi:hypothetical protein
VSPTAPSRHAAQPSNTIKTSTARTRQQCLVEDTRAIRSRVQPAALASPRLLIARADYRANGRLSGAQHRAG